MKRELGVYGTLTETALQTAHDALVAIIGEARWNGRTDQLQLLSSIAGDVGEEWREAASSLQLSGTGLERVLQLATHPLIQQFVYLRDANSLLDIFAAATVCKGLVSSGAGVRACDLGCGTGRIATALSQLLAISMHGVDKEQVFDRELGQSVRFTCCDFAEEEPDIPFDIVFAINVHDHFLDAFRFWEALANWCRTGGIALITVMPDTLREIPAYFGWNYFLPLFISPAGGKTSEETSDPTALVICQRLPNPEDAKSVASSLLAEFHTMVGLAKPFLEDESVPYERRSYAQFALASKTFETEPTQCAVIRVP